MFLPFAIDPSSLSVLYTTTTTYNVSSRLVLCPGDTTCSWLFHGILAYLFVCSLMHRSLSLRSITLLEIGIAFCQAKPIEMRLIIRRDPPEDQSSQPTRHLRQWLGLAEKIRCRPCTWESEGV
jgi:hypothetical protein